jgi:transcriptional regulator with GAF, ATPase, and Fis domain
MSNPYKQGSPAEADVHLPPYLNGVVLTTVLIATVVGIFITVPPLLSEEIAAQWPWPRPGFIVLCLLLISLTSIIALFHQQRFVRWSHERYEESRAEAIETAQRNIDRLYAIHDVSHMIGKVKSLKTVFDHITKACGTVFECHMASLMLYENKNDELVVCSIGGKNAIPEALGSRQKLGNGVAGRAARERIPLLLSRDIDPSQYPNLELKSKFVSAAMVVPILIDDDLVGVLNVSTHSKTVDYDESDLKALQVFAANVGAQIQYSQRITALTQSMRDLKNSLKGGGSAEKTEAESFRS